MRELELTPQVFVILAGLVEERVGLHYEPADREMFASKVTARALEAGFESLLDYYYYLRYDDPEGSELDALVESLVVRETYLFRESEPLRVVVDELAEVHASGRRPRLWSAACATGEEPLTVAMLLADRGLLGEVDLLATDVSRVALERARSGDLGPRSLRGRFPPELVEAWTEGEGRERRVDPRLVDAVTWRHLNLLDESAFADLGCFDAVLCRNVLIYFSDDTAREVVARLTATLRPGGALVVGASESLLRLGTGLVLEEKRGAFLYRKPEGP